MEEKIKWRFNGNNYTPENGLDTADMETFRRDPIASLARETCQNSIDAKLENASKVIMEFHSYTISKEKIPGRIRLANEIKSCKEYKKNDKKTYEKLEKMEKEIEKDTIDCLRISDFNTKGLKAVSSRETTSSFYLLTKGSGLTDKFGTSGGSKGIGKYASFVASKFNTVFYSTYNMDGEKGHIGISKLCSTTIPGSEEKTQGTGYFGIDEKNSPILEQFSLDNEFTRTSSGTDIYILGFRKEENWIQEIVSKILESFMAAIAFDELEVKINDIVINKDNLKDIINNDELILAGLRQSIKSQYIMLTEEQGVQTKEISIENYGNAKIYVKGFSKEEAHLATNDCVMVRYPYMKIKTIKNVASVPCAALCIIENNTLNEILRNIENPQHTDWELKRIDDDSYRNEVKNIIKQLRQQIQDFIYEVLSSSQEMEIDMEGAGEFLPENSDCDIGTNGGDERVVISDRPVIVKTIKNKVKSTIGDMSDENANSLQPDIGSHVPGTGSLVPEGNNNGNGGDVHPTDKEEGIDENGDNEILRLVPLRGLQYRLFVVDKNSGKFIVSFNSIYDEEDCELELYYLDDSNVKYKLNILECLINGEKVNTINGKAVNMKLHIGKTKIELITDIKELYACEVKIYANRK